MYSKIIIGSCNFCSFYHKNVLSIAIIVLHLKKKLEGDFKDNTTEKFDIIVSIHEFIGEKEVLVNCFLMFFFCLKIYCISKLLYIGPKKHSG